MDEETNELHDKIGIFLIESIEILEKDTDLNQIPNHGYYTVTIDKVTHKIVKKNSPNWYQLKLPKKLLKLDSHKKAVQASIEHSILRDHQGKFSYAFGNGAQFNIGNVPTDFLIRIIAKANKLNFDSDTFKTLFDDFLKYVDPKREDYSRIIVPFDNFLISKNQMEIENGFRIRMLTNEQLVDLINNNSILNSFYGSLGHSWFKCVMEIDLPFKWFWCEDANNSNLEQFVLQTRHPISFFDMDRSINQEIIILRTLYKYPITAPTYSIDYRGWEKGGMAFPIQYLPWRRSTFSMVDPVDIEKYQNYRKKMLSINKKSQQRVFVAMRKLAYSLDKMSPGDQLVDTVSGLEGLVLGPSESEISHKFAERVSLLLEDDPGRRIKLLSTMKDAYKLRSKVAHGTTILDNFDIFTPEFKKNENIEGVSIKGIEQSQQLRNITTDHLQTAILLCLDKQSTIFKWDEMIMGTTIKP